MRVGSCFSGVGMIDAGLCWAGFDIAWQIEIDPFAQTVLRKHWPSVPKFTDIRTVAVEDLEPVDVIVGGFP